MAPRSSLIARWPSRWLPKRVAPEGNSSTVICRSALASIRTPGNRKSEDQARATGNDATGQKTRTLIDVPYDAICCNAMRSGARLQNRHQPGGGELDSRTPVLLTPGSPTLSVMEILTQRDHVADETPLRGRARIGGSAIAPRFGRFADSPASAGVPCCNGSGYLAAAPSGDRYWESGRPPYY